jgi:processive 1,2-diacylglycerol beta-glucosyltransferase
MKTIGIFTSGYGHESIADAIAEKITTQAGKKYKVKKFFRKEILSFAYNSAYKFIPESLGPPFHLSSKVLQKERRIRQFLESLFVVNTEQKIREFVKKNKIDLCISTYFGCNPVLEALQKEGIPLINIVTDPRSAHSLLVLNQAKAQMVFDKVILGNYKNKNMKCAGWFVRKKFEKPYDQLQIRKKLKLDNHLTFLLVSGSEGSNTILKILPSIINCHKKVNFIVACGKNKFLYNNILGIKQSLADFSSSKANVIPLAYSKNLHLYMQAADMIIGKAGPNTLFESVACETAFFAITHIHGQEDGNLDIIKDYKIGIVEENAKKANQELEKLIQNPKKITTFKTNIKKLKAYNQNSINILIEEIDRLLQ